MMEQCSNEEKRNNRFNDIWQYFDRELRKLKIILPTSTDHITMKKNGISDKTGLIEIASIQVSVCKKLRCTFYFGELNGRICICNCFDNLIFAV